MKNGGSKRHWRDDDGDHDDRNDAGIYSGRDVKGNSDDDRKGDAILTVMVVIMIAIVAYRSGGDEKDGSNRVVVTCNWADDG